MIPMIMDDSKSLTELVNDETCIGRLVECTSALVDEERNGAYTLELEVPMSAKYFSELHVNGILKVKANQDDDLQLFRIESISEPYGDVVTVNANHISYDLNKVSVLPCSAVGADEAVNTIKSNMIGGTAFSILTDWLGTIGKFKNEIPQPARSLFGGQSGSLIDVYGGEWHFDNLKCTLMRKRGTDRNVQLRYGKNITSIEQETNIESMYTHVQPYVAQQDADAIVGTLHQLKEVSDDNIKIYILDLSDKFSDLQDDDGNQRTPTVAEIDSACDSYIKANDLTTPKVSIDLEYVNLADVDEYKKLFMSEKIALCDTVHVYFPKMNINVSAKVVSSEWNVLKERYESLEIGDAKSTLANTVVDISSESKEYTDSAISQINSSNKTAVEKAYKELEDEMKNAVTKLKEASGGKTVLHDSTDESNDIIRNELYAYDGDSLATSPDVLRINSAGIAGTDEGINGEYKVAITTSGKINGEQILANTIYGLSIAANTITVGNLEESLQSDIDEGAQAKEKADANEKSIDNLQKQVDGQIETWFYDYAPSNDKLPTSDWTTDVEKDKHIGDLFYDNATGYSYRYTLQDGEYKWIQLSDSDITKALEEAQKAQTTANSKRRVFVTTPTVPYDVGDLWVQGNTQSESTVDDSEDSDVGDILVCATAKSDSESYDRDDWVLASDYTDDTIAKMAQLVAGNAQTSANNAQDTASRASDKADNAQESADNAQASANEANEKANNAQSTADEANEKANSLSNDVSRIDSNINSINDSISRTNETVSEHYQRLLTAQNEMDALNQQINQLGIDTMSTLLQRITINSAGVKISAVEDGTSYVLIQNDGMHVYVNGKNVANYLSDSSDVAKMFFQEGKIGMHIVDIFSIGFYPNRRREPSTTLYPSREDTERGTAFFYDEGGN